MKFIRSTCIVLLVAALACPAIAGKKVTLRMATTTSTYETGLLDEILPPFEKEHGIKVHVISVGTGKAIKIAENGDVDLILVHARGAEDKFVKDGYGVDRRDVMYNDFVLLGPKHDPANIMGISDVKEAFKAIRLRQEPFISRGDDSGTHKKEKSLWAEAKVQPAGAWYMEAGQGMSATLLMADEKEAYVIVDRATYLARKEKLRLVIISEGGAELRNPYGVIAVNPKKHKHVKHKLAVKLMDWLVSAECRKLIGEFKKSDQQLFHPGTVDG